MRRRLWALTAGTVITATAGAWLAVPELMEDPVAATASPLPLGPRVEAGRYLAFAGDCVACHTVPGGVAFAGGRPIPTPFGDVFSSNLTPDAETGLGSWTNADFYRALHYGKSRDGHRLTPAFPFTNTTRITRTDSDDLFAYLQSLAPVRQPTPPPALAFPYGSALAQVVWRALYFRPGEWKPRPGQSAEVGRGGYLVEGLGHCDVCHTTRDALGGIEQSKALAGGTLPALGWDAPPLAVGSAEQALETTALLEGGTAGRRAVAGPMAEVVFRSLQYLRPADIAAMVAYLGSLPPRSAPEAAWVLRVSDAERIRLRTAGALVYRDQCAGCHGDHGEGRIDAYPALAGSQLLTAASPGNALRLVLSGGFPPSTAAIPQPYGMPPFSQSLDPAKIAAVLTFTRSAWGNDATAVSETEVRRY